eukprot:2766437-Pleurochrysis_carterae.AAC.2
MRMTSRTATPAFGAATVRGQKRRRRLCSCMGYKWTEAEEEAYANQGRVVAGVVLYRIVWQGCPPDVVWYEPGENLGSKLLREFEQSLAAASAADEASARKDAELIDLEESERMPA